MSRGTCALPRLNKHRHDCTSMRREERSFPLLAAACAASCCPWVTPLERKHGYSERTRICRRPLAALMRFGSERRSPRSIRSIGEAWICCRRPCCYWRKLGPSRNL
jgi:hypothetical protein